MINVFNNYFEILYCKITFALDNKARDLYNKNVLRGV